MSSSSNRGSHLGPSAAALWTPDEIDLFALSATGAEVMGRGPAAEAASAQDEINARIEEAYARGRDEGRAAGRAEERDRLTAAVRVAEQALASVREGERRWIAHAEENIVALAVAVARHVIEREIGADDELLRTIVARALTEFPIEQAVTVRVNPADLALLSRADATSHASARKETAWIADPRVVRGGCVIEGRDRIIDGRVDTALERLYRQLSATGA